MTDNSGIVVDTDASRVQLRAVWAAADAERRTFERALHDGVQQDLIAVAVRLQLARLLADSDLPAALALLDELRGDVRDALDRVRAIADEIYPALLEAQGLPNALRAAASAAGVVAHVDAPGLGRYGVEVEAAVYFCCRAALEQVAAHAGTGARATIHLGEDAGILRFELAVTDAGSDESAFALVRDRVEALGGMLSIESEPGRGTTIAATVPL
jgi:signal transduction histidine kinase